MKRAVSSIFVLAFAALFVVNAAAQGQPPSDPRMDDVRKLQDFNRVTDAQNKDKANQIKKEERTAIVNAAFRRLQMLHNEMIAMMSALVSDTAKITATAEEVKLRATELNTNLALPPLPDEKKKQQKAEPPSAKQPTPAEYMSALCVLIRDFAKNVNLSPHDPKAGVQARRELVALVDRSNDLLQSITPAAKP
jgi:hypothetical protein